MEPRTLESIIAQVLFGFCSWVVESARERGLDRLYFLARDGYLLREIAQIVCQKRGYDIDCRYLYASRLAWRLPACYLCEEEGLRYVFDGALRLTFRGMMERFRADENQYRDCAQWAGVPQDQMDTPLTEKERQQIAWQLQNSREFRSMLDENSRKAYAPTVAYLKQEGLLDGEPVALVDTGWTGGMQHTLRLLLESAGSKSPLMGFYFGLYTTPGDPADGQYNAWYFSPDSPVWYAALFHNNVLESLCVAPHTMTVGYTFQDGRAAPELRPPGKNLAFRIPLTFLEECRRLAKKYGSQDGAFLLQNARKQMRRLCCTPTSEEAAKVGQALFCDDVSESYLSPLAAPISQQQAGEYLIWNREKSRPGLFWPCGSLAVSKVGFQWWYRLHIYGWEAVRVWRMKRRKRHAVYRHHRHS